MAQDTPASSETAVKRGGLLLLGAYLVIFMVTIVAVMSGGVPSCDPKGLVVTGVSPSQVLTEGGAQARITGDGFRQGAVVRVDGADVQASVISSVEIAMATPQHAEGRARILVSQGAHPAVEVPGGLEYVHAGPVIRRVVPIQALASGDTLRVLGDRFKPGAQVQIGGLAAAPAIFVSPSELVVPTARQEPSAGALPVVVTQAGEMAALQGGVQFVAQRASEPPAAALQITAIEPATSQVGGGEQVTITGAGFTPETAVHFGGMPARSLRIEGTRVITAVTPMHAAGPVSVSVATEQAVNSLDGKFGFVCPPVPESTMVLMVLLAGALGGLVHALRSFFWYVGEQKLLVNWVPMYVLLPFSSSALGFVFYLVIRAGLYQPTAGTSYLLVGLAALVGMFSTQATEKLKAIAEGIFSKAPAGANPALPAGATNPAVLAISGIKPGFGPVSGGTVVSIAGSGFTPQSVVRFDQVLSAKTTFVSPTSLKAVAPPQSVKLVDVAVKLGDREVVKEKSYQYVTPKGTISSVAPDSGPAAGGTQITIKGNSFAGDVAVSFGEAQGVSPKVVDGSTIQVTTPAHALGKVDIRIDLGSDVIAVAPNEFEYT